MTAPEKGRWYWVRNWLHYHWVYLVIAAVVLWVGISWLADALPPKTASVRQAHRWKRFPRPLYR